MKRFKVLFGQRRFQALITIAAIMLAASVVVASGANFTSTSANASNVFTAGNLSLFNSKDATYILRADKMKPGQTETGSVVITNDGDMLGTFSFTKTMGANVLGLGDGDFSTKLDLTITEGATATPIWTGKIGDPIPLAAMNLGTWAVGATHTYNFAVHFPNDGTPGSNTTGDNAYKSAAITVVFDWTAVQ